MDYYIHGQNKDSRQAGSAYEEDGHWAETKMKKAIKEGCRY